MKYLEMIGNRELTTLECYWLFNFFFWNITYLYNCVFCFHFSSY